MGLKKYFSNMKGINKILDKEGFYIILFLCVCIVGTTAVWVTKINIDRIATEDIKKAPLLEESKKNIEDFNEYEYSTKQPVIVVEDIKEDEILGEVVTAVTKKQSEHKETKKVKESKPKEKKNEEEIVETKKVSMNMPVIGKIGMNYAENTLTYSKTLDQYTTHYGIDIIAEENTPVTAVLNGEVVEVSRDSKLGITITLAHEGDMITKYANLSIDTMVKVGDKVEMGQTISGVGKTALFETLEEPHLHFEVLVDGKNIDPNQFLKNKQ